MERCCRVADGGSLILVGDLIQPPVALLETLKSQVGKGEPRRGHVGGLSNGQSDAAKLKQVRGGGEAKVDIDAASHRRLLGAIEVPARARRSDDGDVDTLRAAPSTHAGASR